MNPRILGEIEKGPQPCDYLNGELTERHMVIQQFALRGAQNAEVAEVAMETPASQGAPSASAPAAPLVERWNRVAQVLSAAFPANHPCMLDCAEVGLAIKRNAAALEAAQWDARRYRWLRDNSANQYEHPIVVSQERTERGITYTGPLFDSMLDAAIDAAVRK